MAGKGLVARVKKIFRKGRKAPKQEEPSEPAQAATPQQEAAAPKQTQTLKRAARSEKALAAFRSATSARRETAYLALLVRAQHHPEVLSIRHSLRLAAASGVLARNNVRRVFVDRLRPAKPFFGPERPPKAGKALLVRAAVEEVGEDAVLAVVVEAAAADVVEDAPEDVKEVPEVVEVLVVVEEVPEDVKEVADDVEEAIAVVEDVFEDVKEVPEVVEVLVVVEEVLDVVKDAAEEVEVAIAIIEDVHEDVKEVHEIVDEVFVIVVEEPPEDVKEAAEVVEDAIAVIEDVPDDVKEVAEVAEEVVVVVDEAPEAFKEAAEVVDEPVSQEAPPVVVEEITAVAEDASPVLEDPEPAAKPASPRPLHIYDFVEEGYLGSGTWGFVHLYRHIRTGERVAIKAVLKSKVTGRELQLLREQAALRAVAGQDGVVDLLGSFHDDAYFYFAMRYCAGGDLTDLLEQGLPPDNLQRFYAAQLLVNLERVHKRGVVHRDLKPANIFLDRTGNLVLGDFGLAAFTEELEGPPMDFVGTAEYIAREIWQGENYSCASDVWAYGAVLFELAVGRRLWESSKCKNVKALKNKAIGGCLQEWLRDDTISDALCLLLESIFEEDAHDRPTLAALKRHQYFESIDWDALENGTLAPPIIMEGDEDEEPIRGDLMMPPIYDDDEGADEHDVYAEFNFTAPLLLPAPAAPATPPTPALDTSSTPSSPASSTSSLLLTPTPDADALPALPSAHSSMLLCTAFRNPMPASYASDLDCYADSFAFETLPDCPPLRDTPAIVAAPATVVRGEDTFAGCRAQIVRVFGREDSIDYDAGVQNEGAEEPEEWEYTGMPSCEDLSPKRRGRFLARMKAWTGRVVRV